MIHSYGRASLRAARNIVLISMVLAAMPRGVGSVEAAETLTVREVMEQKEQWDTWIREKIVLTISGRYEGRVAKQFRLENLPVLMTPARTTVLPPGVAAKQRVTVSGVLRQAGSRHYMDVSRIAIGATDMTRLTAMVAKVDDRDPRKLYELADEYAAIAEFYDDDELRAQILQLRREVFAQERRQLRQDPAGLLKLADRGAAMGFPETAMDAIRFESMVARYRSSTADQQLLLRDMRQSLTGWDRPNAFPTPDAEQMFLKNMVSEYEAADVASRQRMHRRFYRLVRLADILRGLKPDGSNGQAIAATLTRELPEETVEIDRVKTLYADHRLERVPQMTRKQLEDVELLLSNTGRSEEFQKTLEEWLQAQEARLNNNQLDGQLLMADEYLFAWERWKQPEHAEAAASLLKRAWMKAEKAAPKEAAEIGQRLERLGWTRLHDRWLTLSEVASLPRNDVELAMREGRVVAGMNRAQIIGTLGEPSRRIRVVSAQNVQEIWVFGEVGSTAITVHLQRKRFQSPEQSVATLVSKTAP
ncbi:MAG: hypothetical protein RIK87_03490 [Fuerstiella sp.]